MRPPAAAGAAGRERLLVNAEVPTLAGIVAYRRHDLDTSRQRFETSRQRNAGDCEIRLLPLASFWRDLRQWPATAEALVASGLRMRATSFFNIAVASLSLGRATIARQYAEMVADDEQFGERAREIRSRLK